MWEQKIERMQIKTTIMSDWSGIHPIVKVKDDSYDDDHVYGSDRCGCFIHSFHSIALLLFQPFTRWLPRGKRWFIMTTSQCSRRIYFKDKILYILVKKKKSNGRKTYSNIINDMVRYDYQQDLSKWLLLFFARTFAWLFIQKTLLSLLSTKSLGQSFLVNWTCKIHLCWSVSLSHTPSWRQLFYTYYCATKRDKY